MLLVLIVFLVLLSLVENVQLYFIRKEQRRFMSTPPQYILDLQTAVAQETSVDQSIVALVNNLSAQLQQALNQPDPSAAVQAVIAQMKTNAAGLAAAILANTPSAPKANPVISALDVTTGPVGTVVTISGSGFGANEGPSVASFNGVTGTAQSWSDTQIVLSVPPGATTGNVVVTVNGVVSNGVAFTVGPTTPQTGPSISALSPTSGAVGSAVAIQGAGFGSSQGSGTVTFNGVDAGTASAWSDTSITIAVPAGAATGPVVVTVNGTASNGSAFTVTQ